MTIVEEESRAIPYLTSPICNVQLEGYPKNAGFMAYIKALPLDGDGGKLMRLGYLPYPLESNTREHTPLPIGNETTYLLRAELVPQDADGYKYYRLGTVYDFIDLNVSYSKLGEMPVEERGKLVSEAQK
jgi:hypothetical protein